MTALLKSIHEDYTKNFMPRKKIVIKLQMEEVILLLSDTELRHQIMMTFPFQFYVRLLARQTFGRATSTQKGKEFAYKILTDFWNKTSWEETREVKSIIAQIILDEFPDYFGVVALSDMYSNTSLCDSYCAQKAFEIRNTRGDE